MAVHRERLFCFHPLKAGRRQPCSRRVSGSFHSFHPLKAGRRLKFLRSRRLEELVSIPSRRVGDPRELQRICCDWVSIPSRRVGDLGAAGWVRALEVVSIPSRRVGDPEAQVIEPTGGGGFHPLKAGRRLRQGKSLKTLPNGFHPLKAGRRLFSFLLLVEAIVRFHPLKAGRRLARKAIFQQTAKGFPSPQGGSETVNP